MRHHTLTLLRPFVENKITDDVQTSGPTYQDDASVADYINNYLYGYIPLGSDTNFEIKVRCGNDKDAACTKAPPNAPAGAVTYALTVNNHDFVLCDPFFTLPEVPNDDSWCDDKDRVIAEFETGCKLKRTHSIISANVLKLIIHVISLRSAARGRPPRLQAR